MSNFSIDYVLESLLERWFEDAKINTNIIIAQRGTESDLIKFIFLKKKLNELIGKVPPASDFTANERYYERIQEHIYSKASRFNEKEQNFSFLEDEEIRIVAIRKSVLNKLERWGIFKGPNEYLEMVLNYVNNKAPYIRLLGDVLEIERGLTTNANEIFYLPSKYWNYENESVLSLVIKKEKTLLTINKKYLKPLIRPDHIEDSHYLIKGKRSLKKEDYVVYVEDTSKVDDKGAETYISWMNDFIRIEHETDPAVYPTLYEKLGTNIWTKLPEKPAGLFVMKNGIHKTFAIYMNNTEGSFIDKRLFIGNIKDKSNQKVVFATLNSVITYLGMELIGRSNLGEGALDVNVVDYKKIPIVDPLYVEGELKKNGLFDEFIYTVDKMLESKPENIEQEANNQIRLKVEEYIFRTIGLQKKDVGLFYDKLINLVTLREEKARSYQKN